MAEKTSSSVVNIRDLSNSQILQLYKKTYPYMAVREYTEHMRSYLDISFPEGVNVQDIPDFISPKRKTPVRSMKTPVRPIEKGNLKEPAPGSFYTYNVSELTADQLENFVIKETKINPEELHQQYRSEKEFLADMEKRYEDYGVELSWEDLTKAQKMQIITDDEQIQQRRKVGKRFEAAFKKKYPNKKLNSEEMDLFMRSFVQRRRMMGNSLYNPINL